MRQATRSWIVVFASTFVFYALLTHGTVFLAGNDASRFAQMEALVDQGQGNIDDSRYAWTVDRVTIEGKQYSNKPPLLSIIGALVYFVLQRVTGFSFEPAESTTVYLLTLLIIGGSSAWLVAAFWQALQRYAGVSKAARIWTTVAVAAGTILTSFTTTFNNHTVAAAGLFIALQAAWSGRAVLASALVALVTCIDIVPGLVFIPVVAWLLLDTTGRRGLYIYLSGLASGVLVFVAANLAVVGQLLPPKWIPGGIDESSRFAPSVAGVLLPDRWSYPLECLFGWHGFFTVSPVLVLGAIGWVLAARTGSPLPKRWTLALGAACAVMVVGHVLLVGSYGGWSYGFRYLIPIVPIVMFYAPPVVDRFGLRASTVVLAVSILFALIGAYNPWPPAYEQESGGDPVASLVTNPIGGNTAAWIAERYPESSAARGTGRLFIDRDERLQDDYLYLFYTSQGKSETALEHRRRIAASRPQDAEARYALGLALSERGRNEEAAEELAAAVRLDEEHVEAHYLLGTMRQLAGDPARAAVLFRRTIELDPRQARAHQNLGVLLAREGRLAEALEHLEQAARLEPDDPLIRANLARVRQAMGR